MTRPRPILLTGSHRSGSTWVGRVLASCPEVFYVHEPLNAGFAPHYLGIPNLPWYPHIHAANEDPFRIGYERILSGQFPPLSPQFFRPDKLLRYRFLHAITFRWAAARRRRFLLKEPFAVFSVVWFEERFNARSLLLVRHPAAFVASLRTKNWPFDFQSLASQESLLAGPLRAFRDQIEAAALHPPDLIGQGCLLWNCVNAHLHALREEKPDRLLLRHEDLCRDPFPQFRDLFHQLRLPWSRRAERFLRASSSARETESQKSAFWFRDSHGVARNWKSRLSAHEISRIRRETEPVWPLFYDAADWE